jgi:hypothetical protein
MTGFERPSVDRTVEGGGMGEPSTVDIVRAIADGRRRRRTRHAARIGAVAGSVGLALAGGWALARPVVPHAPAPPTACALQRLPVPGGGSPKSVVTGADPSGRYLVGRWYPNTPLLWHDGRADVIRVPGSDAQLRDVTSTGVAVGTSYVGESGDEPAAWVYRTGTVTRLAGARAEAYAVNEKLTIAGSVDGRPARWSGPGSPPTPLALPGPGWTGYAAGIGEDGTIVGQLRATPDTPVVGYVWRPDGSGQQLPAPVLGGAPATGYGAVAVRGDWAVGWASRDDGGRLAVGAPRWNLRTGAVDVPFEGAASAVNRYGWVVGGSARAVVVVGAGTLTLPDLGSTAPVANDIPVSMSDDGTTIGGQVPSPDGDPVAVVWHCR